MHEHLSDEQLVVAIVADLEALFTPRLPPLRFGDQPMSEDYALPERELPTPQPNLPLVPRTDSAQICFHFPLPDEDDGA